MQLEVDDLNPLSDSVGVKTLCSSGMLGKSRGNILLGVSCNGECVGKSWNSDHTWVKFDSKGIRDVSFFPVVSRFLRVWISPTTKGSSQHLI